VTAKILRWLGLRKQHLGCHNGCGLMAVDIHCRILGTALCEMAGVTGCCMVFTWGCLRTEYVHYRCRAAVRSRFRETIKSTEHCRVTVIKRSTEHCRMTVTKRKIEHFMVTVNISSTEHFTVTVTYMSLSRQYCQYVYWRLVTC